MQEMIQLLSTKKQQDELLKLSFELWPRRKTKEEITKLVPLHKTELKNWYRDNVFDGILSLKT